MQLLSAKRKTEVQFWMSSRDRMAFYKFPKFTADIPYSHKNPAAQISNPLLAFKKQRVFYYLHKSCSFFHGKPVKLFV